MITEEIIIQAKREGKEIRFMTDAQIVVLCLGLIIPAGIAFIITIAIIASGGNLQ